LLEKVYRFLYLIAKDVFQILKVTMCAICLLTFFVFYIIS